MRNHTEILNEVLNGQGPLKPTELLSKADYERVRSPLLKVVRALKSLRRIQLGAHFSILFENRVTVWTQIQEEMRWVKLPSAADQIAALEQYNPLLVRSHVLPACLFLDTTDGDAAYYYATTYNLARLNLCMHLQGSVLVAAPLASTDNPLQAVTYLQFVPTDAQAHHANMLQWCNPAQTAVALPPALSLALSSESALLPQTPWSHSPTIAPLP